MRSSKRNGARAAPALGGAGSAARGARQALALTRQGTAAVVSEHTNKAPVVPEPLIFWDEVEQSPRADRKPLVSRLGCSSIDGPELTFRLAIGCQKAVDRGRDARGHDQHLRALRCHRGSQARHLAQPRRGGHARPVRGRRPGRRGCGGAAVFGAAGGGLACAGARRTAAENGCGRAAACSSWVGGLACAGTAAGGGTSPRR